MLFGKRAHDGGGFGISRVALRRRLLEDDACCERGTHDGIALRRVRRMDGVRHVDGEQKSVGERTADGVAFARKLLIDAAQHIAEHGGTGTLLRSAADLLVVEERDEANALCGMRFFDALEAGEHGGEVVEPRRGDEFVAKSEGAARLARVSAEIVGEDGVSLCFAGFGEPGVEEVLFCVLTEESGERQHVFLRVQGAVLVDVTVHVDGKARDRHERLLKVDEPHLGMKGVLAAQHDFARERERPVEPCAQDESAVRFDVERAAAVMCHACLGLQAKAREVRVRRRHKERRAVALERLLADDEGEERRAVDAQEVASAGGKTPRVRRLEFLKARTKKSLGALLYDMKRGGRALDETEQFFCRCGYGCSCHERFLRVCP